MERKKLRYRTRQELNKGGRFLRRTSVKKIDVNIKEKGTRLTEIRRKIDKIFRDGQRQFEKENTHSKGGDNKLSGVCASSALSFSQVQFL